MPASLTSATKVAFKNCVAQGESTGDADYLFDLWVKELEESVDGDRSKVPDVWCSVVADNTAVNPAAAKRLEKEFPTIFFNGCRTHCADLLVEDIAKIPEIAMMLKDCLKMIKFILGHSRVKEAFIRITKEANNGGTMVKLFPGTRFAYAALSLDSLIGAEGSNWANIQSMILKPQWESGTCSDIDIDEVETFRSLAQDDGFLGRIKAVQKLFSILSAFVHHQETPGTRASFVLPLFKALRKDVNVWVTRKGSDTDFNKRTLEAIKQKITNRWMGHNDSTGRKISGLYGPQFLMATMVDPFFCVDQDDLPSSWEAQCKKIIKRFHPVTDDPVSSLANQAAIAELDELALCSGKFGEIADDCKQTIKAQVGQPPTASNFGHVAHEIKHQKAVLESRHPANLWRLHLGQKFPKLYDLALRLLMMGTQSADVERVCKANKIVHSKVRNRLSNKNVKMLLYCYVNLRLLKKGKHETSSGAAIDPQGDMEDFLGQALLATTDDNQSQNH